MEEKSEGALTTGLANQNTSNSSSDFTGGAATTEALEEQLKKAEQTLKDLQAMKAKFEEEKNKSKQSADSQEKESVEKLKEENKHLKDEIESLKSVITSLKDDLSTTAEQFQSKVADSLKKLDGQVAAGKVAEAVTRHDEPTASSAAPVQAESEKTPASEEAATPVPENPQPATNTEAAPAEAHDQTAEMAVDDELSEYEKIKRELEALEEDNVFLSSDQGALPQAPAQIPAPVAPASVQVASTEASIQPAAAPAPKDNQNEFWNDKQQAVPAEAKPEKKHKGLLSLIKKEKKEKVKEETKIEKEEIKPGAPGGKLAIKVAGFIMILCTAGVVFQIANAESRRTIYTDQVKNAITSAPAADIVEYNNVPSSDLSREPLEARFKEAFVDLPFESTVWKTYSDAEYGIKISYPQNTSHLQRPMGSDNIWFLRKSGYLMKIERFETDKTLEEFYAEHKSDIKYKIEAATFKGQPAMHLIQDEVLEINGDVYLVKINNVIMRIWYKTFTPGENVDDEKRVKQMFDSMEITLKTDQASSTPAAPSSSTSAPKPTPTPAPTAVPTATPAPTQE